MDVTVLDPLASLDEPDWIRASYEDEATKALKSQKEKEKFLRPEKWWKTVIEVGVPFFIAGTGSIAAGIILGHIEVNSSKLSEKPSDQFQIST